MTWDNTLDCWSFIICIVSAAFQIAVFISVILAIMLARRAGLTIGIVTAVWGIGPFFVAVLDKLIYGSEIKLYHIFGMLLIVVMSVLISLSNLFGSNPDVVVVEVTE